MNGPCLPPQSALLLLPALFQNQTRDVREQAKPALASLDGLVARIPQASWGLPSRGVFALRASLHFEVWMGYPVQKAQPGWRGVVRAGAILLVGMGVVVRKLVRDQGMGQHSVGVDIGGLCRGLSSYFLFCFSDGFIKERNTHRR
jgi:hypothetical protein